MSGRWKGEKQLQVQQRGRPMPFPRGGKIACCSMKMEEKFFEEYSTHGTSVRGSRADIRQDLAASLEVDETFQEER